MSPTPLEVLRGRGELQQSIFFETEGGDVLQFRWAPIKTQLGSIYLIIPPGVVKGVPQNFPSPTFL
jgi:hypothetical protein